MTSPITPPQTLQQMAGITPAPGTLSDSVLLIIDAQREYVDGALPLHKIDAALAAGGTLLTRARAAQTPVVHVLHRGSGPLFNPEMPGFQPAAPLVPCAGEPVVEKTMGNAFAGTALAEILASLNRSHLIVVGFMTHNCVSSTVRAARDHGYSCTIVAAATATRDLPDGRGGRITASVVQSACLAGLSDTYAVIVDTAEEIPE